MTKAHWFRYSAAIAFVGFLLALMTLTATPASADEDHGDGFWYFDLFDIQDFHDQGIDGSGVTIAMIDTPINLEVPTLQGANITTNPPIGCTQPLPATSTDFRVSEHGTNVASLLVGTGAGYPGQTGVKGIAPGAKLITYADYHVTSDDDGRPYCETIDIETDQMVNAVNDAVDQGADIISVSLAEGGWDELNVALARAYAHGVIVVAALSNRDGSIAIDSPPGTSNGVLSVGAARPDGGVIIDFLGSETTSVDTDVLGPGWQIMWQGSADGGWEAQSLQGGTSLATPIVAGEIALAMQRYPDATPNQLMQSLIHNTGSKPHDLGFDPGNKYGYGLADARSFLAADPTQYDDINPFIEEKSRQAVATNDPEMDVLGHWGPTKEQILAAVAAVDSRSASPSASATPEPTGSPSPTTAPDPSGSSSFPVMWLLIGAGVLLIILIGAGIAIAVASSKPKNPSGV